MRWPWSRAVGVSAEAVDALATAQRAKEDQRSMWHPVLEVAEEHRSLQQRNHFRDRVVFAMAVQPDPSPRSVRRNRRKDDPQ